MTYKEVQKALPAELPIYRWRNKGSDEEISKAVEGKCIWQVDIIFGNP